MASPTRTLKPAVRAFISYSSHNSALAEQLRKSIEGDGISCFYAPTDIAPREVWRRHLQKEIDSADVILLLYTEAAAASDEVYDEIKTAHYLGKDIWLIKDRKADLTNRFQVFELGVRYQAFSLHGGGQESFQFDDLKRALDARFGRTDPARRGKIDPDNNPYPGKPYTSNDQEHFFGRDAECNQLLFDVYDGQERFFLVYGPSGAGKSSLIDAGLRRLLTKKNWYFSDPISALGIEPENICGSLWRRHFGSWQEPNRPAMTTF